MERDEQGNGYRKLMAQEIIPLLKEVLGKSIWMEWKNGQSKPRGAGILQKEFPDLISWSRINVRQQDTYHEKVVSKSIHVDDMVVVEKVPVKMKRVPNAICIEANFDTEQHMKHIVGYADWIFEDEGLRRPTYIMCGFGTSCTLVWLCNTGIEKDTLKIAKGVAGKLKSFLPDYFGDSFIGLTRPKLKSAHWSVNPLSTKMFTCDMRYNGHDLYIEKPREFTALKESKGEKVSVESIGPRGGMHKGVHNIIPGQLSLI